MSKVLLSLFLIIIVVTLIHHHCAFATTVKVTTTRYIIPNVPYFEQETEYTCGPASLDMSLSYFHFITSSGKKNLNNKINNINDHTINSNSYINKFDQRAIADVARTSNKTGTSASDIIRSGRFSPFSSTPTSQFYLQFPQQAPKAGWFGIENNNTTFINITMDTIYKHVGLLTIYYPDRNEILTSNNCKVRRGGEGGTTCWVKQLVNEFLKNNIPVICLMFYDDFDTEGHYRLAVGYESEINKNGKKEEEEEEIKRIIMWDPYNREGNLPVSNFTVNEFCNLWNYTQPRIENTCYKPYFGAALFPLQIKTSLNRMKSANITDSNSTLQITVNYPCLSVPTSKKYNNNKNVKKNKKVRDNYLPLYTELRNTVAEITMFGEENVKNGGSQVLFKETIKISDEMKVCQEENVRWKVPSKYLEQTKIIRIIVKGWVCDRTTTWLYQEPDKFSEGYSYCDSVGGYYIMNI
ncbi:hypothetical protein ABK040_015931 [Willaertia magna]